MRVEERRAHHRPRGTGARRHTVITGDVWIGPERTTAPERAPLAAPPGVRLTVAEGEALEEAVERAMEGAALGPATGPAGGAQAPAAEPAREARGQWAAAVAVVRSWLTRPERHRAWDARIEERRDTVRRELLLRDPRLW